MADVDKIVDLDQLETWLQTQDVRISRAIAARASLRSLPALMTVSDQIINKTAGAELLLAGLRATLISGVASACATPDMKRIEAAALSAGNAAHSAALSAGNAALSAHSAVFSDAKAAKNGDPHQIFAGALWPRPQDTENLLTMWETFAALHDPTGIWTFWREWYRGMLTGAPMDWDLQLQVALIKDEIWEAGPEDVAKEIERIRQNFLSGQRETPDRTPEHEPKSVKHLIENRIVATACLQGLSVQITDVIERYHAETGANALPDALIPLTEMPQLLNTLAGTLRTIPESGQVSTSTEDQLRADNGRLNAKNAELQETIAALKLEISNLSEPEKKSYWAILKQVALIGGIVSIAPTLVGGAWALSADELGLKQRYENLILDWEFVKTLSAGEISPTQGHTQTEVKESLRPVARPGRA
ncbi:hypothetical protein [Pseudophaeobacter sp.]|uniref:hypothetical protein n=1 Tax=Pseudophaeobacter sp. TaxID=1971739 RepID=UPI002617A45D|nr:hypothetical protein [Pseudophaeobacter sp.]